MSFELPPDPYAALGLTTKADLQAIRSAYRKLVLKCHPDKFTDVNTKAQKQEEFHKIQQAYEAIGEEEAKSRYDASVRLAELRKEAVERQRRSGESTRAEPRATSYNVRTAAPSFHTAAASAEPRSRSYEEIHRDYDEQRSSSRKYEGYESHSRRSPRTDREERTRTEKKKTKDRDERRERSTKYSYVEDDDSDERARYERLRRREEEDREVRRKAEEARRRAEEQRKENEEKPRKAKRAEYAEPVYEQRVNDAKSYIEKSRGGSLDAGRPTPTRSGSSSHYEIRHERPVEVRRSRVSRERRSSRERERKSPYAEIVEPADARRPPPLVQSRSSPANIKVARRSPERSYSEYPPAAPPAPRLNRSDSEPVRSKDVRPAQPSRLRESTTVPHDSGYSSPTTPDQYSPTSKPTPATASTTTTKQYRYAPASGGVSLAAADDDYANPRTVLREPDRYHARSPSPTARPSKHERVVHSSSRTVPVPAPTSPYVSTSQRPPVPHATSYRMEDARVDDRGRERSRRALYGEVTDARRGTKTSGGSYTMDDVKFAKRYGKDDVSYSTANDPLFKAGYEAARREMAAGYGQRDRYDDPPRPRMERSATYAC